MHAYRTSVKLLMEQGNPNLLKQFKLAFKRAKERLHDKLQIELVL
jgi:hypothetical protein